MNRQQFSKYLSGENIPTLPTLLRISQALGKTVDEMLRDPEETQTCADMFQLAANTNSSRSIPSGIARSTSAARQMLDGDSLALGYYLEISEILSGSGDFQVSLSKFSFSETTGLYSRVSSPIYSDNHSYQVEYSGRFSQDNGKISVYCSRDAFGGGPSSYYLLARSDCLIGVQAGHQLNSDGLPLAAPILLTYLGWDCDVRSQLARTGLFCEKRMDPDLWMAWQSAFGDVGTGAMPRTRPDRGAGLPCA